MILGVDGVDQINFLPVIEALKLCLESNNSIFNNKHYLQSDGTVQGPHISSSYSNIAIQYFDIKALEFNHPVTCWKRFRDDIYVVWPHTLEELQVLFQLYEQCLSK